jgi:hypothetical protein
MFPMVGITFSLNIIFISTTLRYEIDIMIKNKLFLICKKWALKLLIVNGSKNVPIQIVDVMKWYKKDFK